MQSKCFETETWNVGSSLKRIQLIQRLKECIRKEPFASFSKATALSVPDRQGWCQQVHRTLFNYSFNIIMYALYVIP
jgi:hypothetical protein